MATLSYEQLHSTLVKAQQLAGMDEQECQQVYCEPSAWPGLPKGQPLQVMCHPIRLPRNEQAQIAGTKRQEEGAHLPRVPLLLAETCVTLSVSPLILLGRQ